MILHRMELNENFEGRIFDICLHIWGKVKKNPSLRYNAFKLLIRISNNHPDLSKEIKSLTEAHYIEMLSDSVKKSIIKLNNETKTANKEHRHCVNNN